MTITLDSKIMKEDMAKVLGFSPVLGFGSRVAKFAECWIFSFLKTRLSFMEVI